MSVTASSFHLSDATKPTGIQVAHKQTSIESGYNIFDEIIWKTGSQWALLHSTLSSDGLRQIYVMISNLAIPISVNLLSK
ncbi:MULTISPECIES: hypothetical protein [unclassified Wolbachia]|uniref:hypothetical protein n=1 Tax=unclassified Wolbachia TaxID=2640676 RepID=UPI00222E2B93|nr:hypothetical protein [Wolbachia endosymbiont (group A) of Tiphia femorata]